MRREFAKVMTELMQKDHRVHLLSGDYDFGFFHRLKHEFPMDCINTGIREQATIGLAAGMAMEGLKPYFYTITPFGLERVFEQIKLDVVQQGTDVKIITYGSYEGAGPTHMTENPKKLCEALGIRYIAPKNSLETREKLLETSLDNKPAFFYLRADQNQK